MNPIENQISDKDLEILEAMKNLDIVSSEQYAHKKKIVELSEAVRQSKYLLSKLRVERGILERQFWSNRNQGGI